MDSRNRVTNADREALSPKTGPQMPSRAACHEQHRWLSLIDVARARVQTDLPWSDDQTETSLEGTVGRNMVTRRLRGMDAPRRVSFTS
jgi:hypothetical protein